MFNWPLPTSRVPWREWRHVGGGLHDSEQQDSNLNACASLASRLLSLWRGLSERAYKRLSHADIDRMLNKREETPLAFTVLVEDDVSRRGAVAVPRREVMERRIT